MRRDDRFYWHCPECGIDVGGFTNDSCKTIVDIHLTNFHPEGLVKMHDALILSLEDLKLLDDLKVRAD
jgi:hypothetical protein